MIPSALLSDADESAIGKWLRSAGDLFVHLEFPHSGGSGDSFLVRSVADLQALLRAVTWPEIELWIFRHQQLPLRGIVDQRLIKRALRAFPDARHCNVCEIVGKGPFYCRPLASPEGHSELRDDLTELLGHNVAIGLDLLANEASDDRWTYEHPDDVFFVRHLRNRNFWPPYPDRRPSLYAQGVRPGTQETDGGPTFEGSF